MSCRGEIGAWLSLVERSVRDREVGGSNPLAPTKYCKKAGILVRECRPSSFSPYPQSPLTHSQPRPNKHKPRSRGPLVQRVACRPCPGCHDIGWSDRDLDGLLDDEDCEVFSDKRGTIVETVIQGLVRIVPSALRTSFHSGLRVCVSCLRFGFILGPEA